VSDKTIKRSRRTPLGERSARASDVKDWVALALSVSCT